MTGRGQRDHQHPATDLGAHQPVGRRLGRMEQGVAGPDIVDVIDPQMRMPEQVHRLTINLERVILVE